MLDRGEHGGGARLKALVDAVARIGLTLAIGIAGAFLARSLAIPLPYLLGPLLACGIAAMAGAPLRAVPYGREIGQVVVGLAIGLRFIPAVVLTVAKLLPFMALAIVLMIFVSMLAAIILRRLAGIDSRTAFFATAAAGVVEMAVVAHQKKADGDIVAVVHLIRVTAIVTTVPFLVTIFGADGGIQPVLVPLAGEIWPLLALFLASTAAAFWVRRLRLPNTWLLVPAIIAAVVAGLDLGPFSIPPLALTIAQIVIGCWLGCRFRRSLLGRLSQVTVSALVVTAFLLAAAAGLATLLSYATGLPFVTSLLALAPAGVTEMVLTATAMHLDSTIVTAFQITRIAVVMTTILFALRIFEALSRRLGASSD
ncbi:AbrB family transcriptional regulator [Rhizobium sp. TH2]|uniref:AbrB family transcriptional regulator n=1 Tax=Rhizobium sp. TH2 TaxID=2775403 RepID=UPI002157E3BF|nr:AbrB family transcriptional regulator [Rhizobium sp. TH2]UVC08644.1 AbrB family transcriptional regulator [Rhizobium sp. TH2]